MTHKQNDVKKLISQLKKSTWRSIWGGSWSLLHASDWGKFYTQGVTINGKKFVSQAVFLYRNGKITAWVPDADLINFAERVGVAVDGKLAKLKTIIRKFREQTDNAMSFMEKHVGQIDQKIYGEYLKKIQIYYRYHLQVKYIVEALPERLLKKFLPYLEEARVYTEPVFSTVVAFDNAFAQALSKKVLVKPNLILMATQQELSAYFKIGQFPPAAELKKRWNRSALVMGRNRGVILSGTYGEQIEKAILPSAKVKQITGHTAYPGKVSGRARIILDPTINKNFQEGNILVAIMTRVEYLPLMKKAAGFVTDAGGILCHAAITAREMHKPCVIGTKVATKVFKDGDMVEVDAEKGVVKKI